MDLPTGTDSGGYVPPERDAWAEAYSVHWDDNNKWDFDKNCWQEAAVAPAAAGWEQALRGNDAPREDQDPDMQAGTANASQEGAAEGGWPQEDDGEDAAGWDYGYVDEDVWYAETWTTEENFLGAMVAVTVTNCAQDVEAWVQQHVPLTDADAVVRLGLDIEWRPEGMREYNQTATLQVSGPGHSLVVQLLHMDAPPEAIIRVLRDPRVHVGGVGIKEDCEKLCTDHEGFAVANPVDLGELAATTLGDRGLRRVGLVPLGKQVLGLDLRPKNKHVTMMDWEVKRLSGPQIRYAAYDAWLSHAIFHKLATGRADHIPLVNA
eukprot:jgi/Mesvir1/9579/Mv25101-RA.1